MTFLALLLGGISILHSYAQDCRIVLYPDSAKQQIASEIYGQFAEHLGRCIYGGIWVGPDSDIPNIEGYRKDVFEAIKALEVPVIRWPGGCFADEYHWMDGVGPQENRPRLVNNNWGGTVEDNSFGTHEFLNLCELLGCEPYISANVGSGSVEEMAKWVEYITSDSESTMAQLRKKNGREKPWRVKYWGVGNESWGCGGQMLPEYYSDLYRRYSIYCRNYSGNQLFKVASGASGCDYNWTETLMKKIGANLMDGLSMHYYSVTNWEDHGSATDFGPAEYYDILAEALRIEPCMAEHIRIMDQYDPEKKVALMVDEWGTWWNVEPGTNPGWLYQQCTMRDAIVASSSLDIFHKYSERVRMTNIAQMVNVLQAMVLTNDQNPHDPCLLTPTYYTFLMYKVHKQATFIPGKLSCPMLRVNDNSQVPAVSHTASRDKNGKTHISLTNIDYDQPHTVVIELENGKIRKAEGQILTHKDVHAVNDFGVERIFPVAFTGAKVKNGQLTVTLPAHSIVTLTIE